VHSAPVSARHAGGEAITSYLTSSWRIIMKVANVMTSNVRVVSPAQTIREAAELMFKENIGALPVGEQDRLVGMITDRDIAIRGIGQGRGPDTKVHEVMSKEIKYCFEDEDLDHVSKNMADIQMRRLPVMNREKRLVGILSLGDLATKRAGAQAGRALHGISQPAH